jgi:hypothetical protein
VAAGPLAYSPVLAVVTGAFEVAAGVYALAGPGRKTILRPAAVILFLLAGYQFSEVLVCANPQALAFSRLAYLIITWLPPFGLRLAVALDERRNRVLRAANAVYFAAAAALCVWILADAGLITRSVCDVVLARYFVASPFDVVYALFYQTALLWIVFGSGLGMAAAADPVLRRHLAYLQMGILGFIFPSMAVRLLVGGRGEILPSVMCHFAFVLGAALFALTLRERRTAPVMPTG